MATQSLISASYSEAVTVSFTEDAWFNATAVAASFDKRVNDWTTLESTKEYLAALDEIFRNQESRFLLVKRGGRGKSDSTWFHPKLAIPFARWLDVRFAVWCDMQIEAILKSRTPYGLKELPAPKTRKALPGCLTCEQQDAIKAMIRSKAETIPDPKAQGGWTVSAWSAVGTKFGVKGMKDGYKNIPAEHFPEVLSLVARLELPMEGELVPKDAAPEMKKHPEGSFGPDYQLIRDRLAYLRGLSAYAFPGHVRQQFDKALSDAERALVSGWTEIDEAMLNFGVGMALLRRWKGTH